MTGTSHSRCAGFSDGIGGAIELVGTPTLPDTISCLRRGPGGPGGTVCIMGILSDSWTIPDFYPMDGAYSFSDKPHVHARMEAGTAHGTMVVLTP